MRLDAAVVRIRRRNAWQAMDAGILLARRWYRPLLVQWTAACLPLLLLVALCAPLLPVWGPALLFWFACPLLEAPLALWAGRALFGEEPGARATLALFRRRLTPGLALRLLWYRVHPFRPFAYPVLLLEHPGPGETAARVALLGSGRHHAEAQLLGGLGIILLLTAALAVAAFGLIPKELRWFAFTDLWRAAVGRRCLFALYALVCGLMAPFNFCGGFMLYISRRVEVEAWDLELGFRNLNRRLREERR